ncbi:hypothetical protein HY213_04150 [Candidatus Peregrinibacteria bacterium]|nr:hypothetical protein [Candidatus Peregrinibacteria bacterium]
MIEKICPITGKLFTVTDREMELRRKLGVDGEPEFHPIYRWQALAAFWQHWALHKRICNRTGKSIISVFPENCPYPVWHKDEWLEHADPASADFEVGRPVFDQLWALFQRCPIPHNIGAGNQNCEYTDDWWYCKNCYLCHSGAENEDLQYCYRAIRLRNSQYCVFSIESERCVDLIDSHTCSRVLFGYKCWQCSDSAFLYDCRNCHDCLFCCNLRNKSYCIGNQQFSKEEYERQRRDWDFRSRTAYERGKELFARMLREQAWHRALFIDQSEQASGNYLHECKDCENCFFLTTGMESAVNCLRAGDHNRDCLDTVSAYHSELAFNTSLPQDQCYDTKCCYNLIQCKWLEYCAFCFQCEHCFGCCGLRGKKHCVLNKQYSKEEYDMLRARIVDAMKATKEWNRFFPNSFAAQPYEESLAGFYWPLTRQAGERLGFRMRAVEPERSMDSLDSSLVPDRCDQTDEEIQKNVYWDSGANRPFQITALDVAFAKDLGAPLPNTFYMSRIQENFRWIPFDGTLRETSCAKCRRMTKTGWPSVCDGRILCEECYLKEVY